MAQVRSLCIFCGSNSGSNPIYKKAAVELGELFAAERINLIYGGSSVGLMGIIADACLKKGGRVIGVIPKALELKEVSHRGLTELHVVDSMHERKHQMFEMSDGFVTIPGGLGTFDELTEMLTWGQLGLHQKPSAILNVNGFYDSFIEQLNRCVTEGFIRKEHRDMLLIENDMHSLLAKFRSYSPPTIEKWIDRAQN